MDTTPLYDLSPALRLMGMGLLLAVGPLLWVRMRSKGAPPARRLQARAKSGSRPTTRASPKPSPAAARRWR